MPLASFHSVLWWWEVSLTPHLGWRHYIFTNAPWLDRLAVLRYYVIFFLGSHDNIGKYCWGDGRRVLHTPVVFTCSVLCLSAISQACLTIASSFTAQHLSGQCFLKTSFGNTDVTKCWNQLLACGTPFKYSSPTPLGTLEIQMTGLSIICYRGCVLQPKPGTVNFGQGFIYNSHIHKHTPGPHWGCSQGLVFCPPRFLPRLDLLAPGGLLCVEVGYLEEAQEVLCALEARSSF